ncbi:MAG TPA: cyclopropane fatty acyl phospholipid synthase [Chromatiales bacterium]|nr:cyclopropane fatty acyl phospholipid synthase [Chromatiales bacterium]
MTAETVSVDPGVMEEGASFRLLEELLAHADIRLDGSRPWDMRLLAPGVPDRIFAKGSLGLGESYLDGEWEADALDEFFTRLLRAGLDQEVRPWRLLGHALRARLLNRQTLRRARTVGEVHYDLGNDFYQAMLDPRMTYTCGYWRHARTLDEAQEAKLDLVCRKLGLRPGQRVLDIGCGWGSFARFAAERHGVEVVGVTISREQAELGRELCQGLPVELRLQDYRELDETFDHIVSLGMFEHVGHKNYRTYLEVAHRCLRDEGLFLLHTIGKPRSGTPTDPWIDRYIFPNGELPAMAQVAKAAEGLFLIEDVHNFGADYDTTLMAWHRNFEAAWPDFAERYGERFHRMWRYYLLSCAGAFRARDVQLWQIVFAKQGMAPLGGYRRPE